MKNKTIATYQISDTFAITGRGIVLAGFILGGTISIGNLIEFKAFDKKLKRRITGIEGIRTAQPNNVNTGILIECENDQEIEVLRIWEPKDTVASVSIDQPKGNKE